MTSLQNVVHIALDNIGYRLLVVQQLPLYFNVLFGKHIFIESSMLSSLILSISNWFR